MGRSNSTWIVAAAFLATVTAVSVRAEDEPPPPWQPSGNEDWGTGLLNDKNVGKDTSGDGTLIGVGDIDWSDPTVQDILKNGLSIFDSCLSLASERATLPAGLAQPPQHLQLLELPGKCPVDATKPDKGSIQACKDANDKPQFNECNVGLKGCTELRYRLMQYMYRQMGVKMKYYYQGHDVDVVNSTDPENPSGPAFKEAVCDPNAGDYWDTYNLIFYGTKYNITNASTVTQMSIPVYGNMGFEYGDPWRTVVANIVTTTTTDTKTTTVSSTGFPPKYQRGAAGDEWSQNFFEKLAANNNRTNPLPHDRLCCGGNKAKSDCGGDQRGGNDWDDEEGDNDKWGDWKGSSNGGWAYFFGDDDEDLLWVRFEEGFGQRESAYVRGSYGNALNCHMESVRSEIDKGKLSVMSPACMPLALEIKGFLKDLQSCPKRWAEGTTGPDGKAIPPLDPMKISSTSCTGMGDTEKGGGGPVDFNASYVCSANQTVSETLYVRLALCEIYSRADNGFTEAYLTDAAHRWLEGKIKDVVEDCMDDDDSYGPIGRCYAKKSSIYTVFKNRTKLFFGKEHLTGPARQVNGFDVQGCVGMAPYQTSMTDSTSTSTTTTVPTQ